MKFRWSFLVVSILVAAFSSACLNDRIKLTCDGGAKINGRDFGCDVCYEELGCTYDSGAWTCPAGVELSCSFNNETLEYCCGGECIDCGEDVTPQVCSGYTGADEDCCRTDDPCGFADNGSCDCDNTCSWERRECSPVKVDVLVVVDNSGSMAAEQFMLVEAFPNLITSLLDPADGTPVRDMHVGVVSTDMGTGGYDVQTCDEVLGDDGVLQHTPRGEGCDASYPTFQSYVIGEEQGPDTGAIEKLAFDFGCIAVLGTRGCGLEQQLEAAWKALMVHSNPSGPNAGFLRSDSILVILFVTDEEDCSADDPTIFNITSLPYSINLQCYYQKDKLHVIDRYVNDFRSLRGLEDDLIVGFLVGVPPGDPQCEGSGDAIGGCLSIPAMQEVVRADGRVLEYACKYPLDCTPPDPPDSGNCSSEAFPAVRFVQLAQQLGDNALVSSICTDSYEPFMDDVAQKVHQVIGN